MRSKPGLFCKTGNETGLKLAHCGDLQGTHTWAQSRESAKVTGLYIVELGITQRLRKL